MTATTGGAVGVVAPGRSIAVNMPSVSHGVAV